MLSFLRPLKAFVSNYEEELSPNFIILFTNTVLIIKIKILYVKVSTRD